MTIHVSFPTPRCNNLDEPPDAVLEREKLNTLLLEHPNSSDDDIFQTPLAIYLRRGFACTVGSALDKIPPSEEDCTQRLSRPKSPPGLTAGARAWSKHAHRSGNSEGGVASECSWWGQPKGPLTEIKREGSRVVLEDNVKRDVAESTLAASQDSRL